MQAAITFLLLLLTSHSAHAQTTHAQTTCAQTTNAQTMPAAFIDEGLVVKGLPGLLTVLHDGGYDDRECIAWIFTDADLPGRPIDALRENRGSEVKRRAQAMGF